MFASPLQRWRTLDPRSRPIRLVTARHHADGRRSRGAITGHHGLHRPLTLGLSFSPDGRLGSTIAGARGAFIHRPVHRFAIRLSDPFKRIVFAKTWALHNVLKKASFLAFKKSACGSRWRCQNTLWARPSMGSRCATRTPWPRRPVKPALAGVQPRVCVGKPF